MNITTCSVLRLDPSPHLLEATVAGLRELADALDDHARSGGLLTVCDEMARDVRGMLAASGLGKAATDA